MNKELTPLEALERVEYNLSEDGTSDLDNALHIIETALKESEKALTFYKYCVKNKIDLAKLDQISNDYVAMPIEVWEEKLKKLAVLEILKQIIVFDTNTNTISVKKNLCFSDETYDLLKEVLKDD